MNTETTTKPGVLAVLDYEIARYLSNYNENSPPLGDLREARTIVFCMAAALKAVSMLRQLGGIMPASREVILAMCDEADEALEAFMGNKP